MTQELDERRHKVVEVPENLVEMLAKHLKDSETQAACMTDAIAAGVERGMLALANSDEFTTKFWRTGYDKLSDHASDGLQKGMGKRIWAALGTMMLSYAIYMLARSGTKL